MVNYLKKNIGDKVELERNNHTQKKVETDTAYIVTSISDKTGEKCIRNGSSRGPDQETLVELNYSIDNSHTTRKKIQTLPLGTRIHIH